MSEKISNMYLDLRKVKIKISSTIVFNINRLRFMLTWLKRRRFKVLSVNHTLEYLNATKCSVARFGDGELNYALKAKYDIHTFSNFQPLDYKLCQRLYEVLTNSVSNEVNLMVCVVGAPLNRGCKGFSKVSKEFWQIWVRGRLNYLIKELDKDRLYGEAAFTRFYMLYRDKSGASKRFKRIKQLWNNDDLLIVEGEKSRLGVGNDIFDNARSIRRILCPATDAFSRYDEILAAVKRHAKPTDTIILALGQTATVLAYDLAHEGYRALDLGHIDIEYEWMRMGARVKVPVPGKFTNEAPGGKEVDIVDKEYKSQILEKI